MKLAIELAREVQELLARYVRREISADALQDDLDALASRLADLPEDSYAAWAADHVEILLAELARDHRSEEEVRRLIGDEILLPAVTVITDSSASTDTGTRTVESAQVTVAA